jgi:hypothetical protein
MLAAKAAGPGDNGDEPPSGDGDDDVPAWSEIVRNSGGDAPQPETRVERVLRLIPGTVVNGPSR